MEARCPYCNSLLNEDDVFDFETSVSQAIEYVVGHCDNCDRSFQWRNVYEFKGIENLCET